MTPTDAVYALIHSPLVGPVTWQPVASEIRRRGGQAIIPALADLPDSPLPFWAQHADSAAQQLSAIPPHQPVIYVSHSGAGALLPAIRSRMSNPAAGYVFVDSGLPRSGATRLEVMQDEAPERAADFRRALRQGAVFPTWGDADLRGLISDDGLRAALVSSIRPRGLAFFDEPIPVSADWPDAPCACIQFSPSYDYAAEQARLRGWPVVTIPAGHFHMLNDAAAVTDAILDVL